MPPKTHVKYFYESYTIKGKVYQIPVNCAPGSRRWHWWIKWQDKGLKLPKFEPKLEIMPHGVLPYIPYEQYAKAAA